ncbi:MAG: DUF4194 domain-containing protein [Deltaproteobacteria bacterium]|jgi:hypothetical protein|nr:DUF4194 domain-containing protein [Deltaproteobacteria bacterium]
MSYSRDDDPPAEPRPDRPWPADGEAEEVGALDHGPEDSYAPMGVLFDGDRGTLPLEARLALCHLLRGPYVDRAVHPDRWYALAKYGPGLNSWLGDVFLELVIDEDLGVAFVRQADTTRLLAKVPTLLRKKPLNFFESLLLIHLRQKLSDAELQGLSPTIAASEMVDYLRVYESKTNTDHARFENRVRSAIVSLNTKFRLLRPIAAAEETYEISPILKLILSPDSIRVLIDEYRNLRYQGIDMTGEGPAEGDGVTDEGPGEADGADGATDEAPVDPGRPAKRRLGRPPKKAAVLEDAATLFKVEGLTGVEFSVPLDELDPEGEGDDIDGDGMDDDDDMDDEYPEDDDE